MRVPPSRTLLMTMAMTWSIVLLREIKRWQSTYRWAERRGGWKQNSPLSLTVTSVCDQGCQAGHVKARMLSYQKEDVDVLIAEFEKRLPQHGTINHLARVLRFDKFPFKQRAIFKPEWDQNLMEIYESITWLCENRYLSLSAHFVTVEWGKLARFLQDQWRRFWDEDEAPTGVASLFLPFARPILALFTLQKTPGSHATTRAAHKPKAHLRLVGDDSLFEAVWDGDIPDIPRLAYMIDDMISLRLCQSDTERAGSFISAVKLRGRTSLGFDMFSSLVSLAFNLPFLGEFDVESLVRAWKAARRRLPVTKSGIGRSSVLSRMRARKSDTFLFKKDTPFTITDFGVFAPGEKKPAAETAGSAAADSRASATAASESCDPSSAAAATPAADNSAPAAGASASRDFSTTVRAQTSLTGMWASRNAAAGATAHDSSMPVHHHNVPLALQVTVLPVIPLVLPHTSVLLLLPRMPAALAQLNPAPRSRHQDRLCVRVEVMLITTSRETAQAHPPHRGSRASSNS